MAALRGDRERLRTRRHQLGRLIEANDRTIRHMTEEAVALTADELFAGFTAEQAERYCGLGQLCIEHDEFRTCFESFRVGLAESLRAANVVHCQQRLES